MGSRLVVVVSLLSTKLMAVILVMLLLLVVWREMGRTLDGVVYKTWNIQLEIVASP